MVSRLMGVTIPKEIEIKVPPPQNNKGSRLTRIRSAYEAPKKKITEEQEHRKCSVCEEHVPHNARTCPPQIQK